MIGIWHWFLTVTGTNNTSGEWYAFQSGFGSDIAEFAILGSLIAVYRHHKCASCWRVGRIQVEGTPYKTCHKHSTVDSHKAIHKRHSIEYPEQHKLLSRIGIDSQSVRHQKP